MTLTARPRSRKVIAMLDYLLTYSVKGEPLTAYELAVLVGVPSRWVYPLLKWWIERGIVKVYKSGHRNLYMIDPLVAKKLSKLLRMILRARDIRIIEAVKAIAARRLHRKLTPLEEALLELLAEKLASRHTPYYRIKARTLREALDVLTVRLTPLLQAKGARTAPDLLSTLIELQECGVVFFKFEASESTLILRLDRSVEEELHKYIT